MKLFDSMRHKTAEEPQREVVKPESEWRRQLDEDQYWVLRQKGTEPPFTGKYVHPGPDGTYHCVACEAPLFEATAQFDSGTGWPSFTEPSVADAVELKRDFGLGMVRTEVVCRRCGGHLGHVFNDGPGLNGRRYCINSVCLALDPKG